MEEADQEDKFDVPFADESAQQYRISLSELLEGLPSRRLIYQAEGLSADKQPSLEGFVEKLNKGESLNEYERRYIADLLSGQTSYKLTFRKPRGNKKRINEFDVLIIILNFLSDGYSLERTIEDTGKKLAAAYSTVEKIEKRGGEILPWYPMMKKDAMAKAKELRRENLRTGSS